jgi:hypothetical protein
MSFASFELPNFSSLDKPDFWEAVHKRSFAQWVCLNGILRIFTLQKCIAHPVSSAIGLCKARLPVKACVSAGQRGMAILPSLSQLSPYV